MTGIKVHNKNAGVFCSYSSKDSKLVKRVLQCLQEVEVAVWSYEGRMRSGRLWKSQLVTTINRSRVFLLMLSPNSADSDAVRRELDLAHDAGTNIIPVELEETDVPEDMQYQIVGQQKVQLFKNFDNALRSLEIAIREFGVESSELLDSSQIESTKWWDRTAVQFGTAAVLAVIGVWLASLMNTVSGVVDAMRLFSGTDPVVLGLFAAIGLWLIAMTLYLLKRWLRGNQPFWGLAIYLAILVPVVLLLGHQLAAVSGVIVATIVSAVQRNSSTILKPGLAMIQTLVLVAAPVLGVAAEHVNFGHEMSRQIAISTFESRDPDDSAISLEVSEMFRKEFQLIFSEVEVGVLPEKYLEGALADWHKDTIKQKLKNSDEPPGLYVRNSYYECTLRSEGEAVYTWLSWLDPPVGYVQLVGTQDEFELITVAAVYEVFKIARKHSPILLDAGQEERFKRILVRELYELLLSKKVNSEVLFELNLPQMLESDSITDTKIERLIAQIIPGSKSCEGSREFRSVYTQNLKTLS